MKYPIGLILAVLLMAGCGGEQTAQVEPVEVANSVPAQAPDDTGRAEQEQAESERLTALDGPLRRPQATFHSLLNSDH